MPVADATRRASAVLLASTLFGCAHPPTLYMWEGFQRQQYDALLHAGASPEEQMHAMELHATKARAANAALPPGFRAHLGMLELNAGHPDRAKDLFEQEKAAFPESAPYMDRLLSRLGPPGPAPKADAPA